MTTESMNEMTVSECFEEVTRMIQDDRHAEAETLSRQVLNRKDLSKNERDEFEYHLGIALDYQEKHFEALEVFLKLHEAQPFALVYLESLRVCLHSIQTDAHKLLQNEPESDKLLVYEETLVGMDWCPAGIRLHVALMRALRGERDGPLQVARGYFELSPNDSSFLKSAHRIARACKDQKLVTEIEAKAAKILERSPYRTELLSILEWGMGTPPAEGGRGMSS
jgi:hypothetical protein